MLDLFHMLDLYFVVRGEILGFTKDELLRNHLSRTLSFIIKNLRLEDRRRSHTTLVPTIIDANFSRSRMR